MQYTTSKTERVVILNTSSDVEFLCFVGLASSHNQEIVSPRNFCRTSKIDWAKQIRHLVDDEYLEAAKIVLVMDNLNTHRISSLYEAFPPAEASRIADKLEIHYTPKHGSWLNIAECELSVLGRQCLGSRRIPDFKSLQKEISPWAADRNAKQKGIDWQFTTEDARIKLKKLYPVLS